MPTIKSRSAVVDLVFAAELFGIGRTGAYELARLGEICPGVPILRVGGRFRVPVAAIERVLEIDLADYADPEDPVAIEPLDPAEVDRVAS